MKKILLIVFVFGFLNTVNCQQQDNSYDPRGGTPIAFIGFSTGIDNMIGVLGPQIDFVLGQNLTVGAGIGLSSWGTKYALNLQYHPKGLYNFYFKGGYSKNSGLDEFEVEMELENGSSQKILMDLKPVSNVFFTFGYGVKLGKRNRFYVEGGYAVPLNADDFYYIYGNEQLSKTSEKVMKILRPGGLVIAAGFNFAIGR